MAEVANTGERDRWSSRLTFILGAVGSAVGLGNLWRFPFLVFDYGGGTFLIPYFISLFFFGIPLLLMEVTLGRQFQGGDPVCFASMHPRLVGIGWMSAFGSFLLAVYYPALISWIVIFFFSSFQDPLPWARVPGNGTDGLGGAVDFFVNDVLGASSDIGTQEGLNPALLGALVFVWIAIYLSIFKGVKVVSQVVKVSVPLPLVTLAVLLFNSLGRDGADDGIQAYIGNWDTSVLGDAAIWQAAVGQVFFSIGVCFGIMTAYSSYMESKKGLVADALWIALIDSGISFYAGFTVFTAVGALAADLEVDFNDPDFTGVISGGSLVFIAYPAALVELDTAPQLFSLLFFLTLFFLAIDSAFSIVEAVIAAIYDTNAGRGVAREKITFFVSFLAFICGIFFVIDNGNYWIDLVDYYLNNYIMLGVGALECMACTWVFGYADSCNELGTLPVTFFSVAYLFSCFACAFLVMFAPAERILAGIIAWLFIAGLSFIIGASMIDDSHGTIVERAFKLGLSGGAKKFGDIIITDEYDSMALATTWYKGVIYSWGFVVKYIIPNFLLLLMLTGAKGNFTSYVLGFDAVYQNVGNFIVAIAWIIFFTFIFFKADMYSDRVAEYDARAAIREEKAAGIEAALVNEEKKEVAVEEVKPSV